MGPRCVEEFPATQMATPDTPPRVRYGYDGETSGSNGHSSEGGAHALRVYDVMGVSCE